MTLLLGSRFDTEVSWYLSKKRRGDLTDKNHTTSVTYPIYDANRRVMYLRNVNKSIKTPDLGPVSFDRGSR